MVFEMLDAEMTSKEIRPLMLYFKDREGDRLIKSWFQRINESNNGIFLTSCFCRDSCFSSTIQAASALFKQVQSIDGRVAGLESYPGSSISYFRRIADWIGNRGLWLTLIDHVEDILQPNKSLQIDGIPVIQSSNVRIIYTTTSEETAIRFGNSGVRVVDVAGSSGHPENEVINQVLRSAGLNLPEEIVSLIADKTGTDDPSFIRQLAGKLRVYGISNESLSIIDSIDLSAEV